MSAVCPALLRYIIVICMGVKLPVVNAQMSSTLNFGNCSGQLCNDGEVTGKVVANISRDGDFPGANRRVANDSRDGDFPGANRSFQKRRAVPLGVETTSNLMSGKNAVTPSVDIGLMLCTNHVFKALYAHWLVPSLRIFWTWSAIKLTVVMPEWETENKAVGEAMRRSPPFPKVHFQPRFDPRVYHGLGYHLQQFQMFFADKFVTSEYVGFLDTDSTFITQVTKEDLFMDGKPIVRGLRGWPMNGAHAFHTKNTFHMLKRKQIGWFMTYFPVIVKTAHLEGLRKHVAKIHGKPFEYVFREISELRNGFSQFDIILNYMFIHHRAEYIFRIPETNPGNASWNGPYALSHGEQEQLLTTEEKQLLYHVCTHWKWSRASLGHNLTEEFIRGFCFSQGFRERHPICKRFNSTLHEAMFVFESFLGSKVNCSYYPCRQLQRDHYANVEKQPEANRLNISILAG
eukprot:Hpha_TRINITY_DN8243_c0_g1::TRINITY_DN8243_c0_g1_i1::g.112009::m.112009